MATAISARDYAALFEGARERLPGAGTWVARLRTEALARFADQGFPTSKTEAWKYTSLRPLARDLFAPAALDGSVDRTLLPAPATGARLVFVNGHYRADLSDPLPEGVLFRPLAEALASGDEALEGTLRRGLDEAGALAALNAAFMAGGAVIEIAGTPMAPLHLVFVGAGHGATATYLRNVVRMAPGAEAELLETYMGNGAGYWTNAVTQIETGVGARLDHAKVQREAASALHVTLTDAHLADGARYRNFALSTGAEIGRNEIHAALDGSKIALELMGVYLARGDQHLDNTTVIDHLKPGSTSKEIYKGVIDDEATGVFQGRIVVHPNAQQTDAHQLNRNMLLSPKAHADAKPELLIYADDVKCSHGATVGDLEADALFYLRARGIPEAEARNLLIEGFIEEMVDRVVHPVMRDYLENMVATWLGHPRHQ